MPSHDATDFEQQQLAQRSDLMRFARLQLRSDAWAEDAVSETLLAALAKPLAFEARSRLGTCLAGMLKQDHRFDSIRFDSMRQRRREVSLDSGSDDNDADPLEHFAFKIDGHFAAKPAGRGNPEQDLDCRWFMAVMDACTQKPPAVQGRLFLMREWLELASEEICKGPGLASTHLYVRSHRARLRLRQCLEPNGFAAR